MTSLIDTARLSARGAGSPILLACMPHLVYTGIIGMHATHGAPTATAFLRYKDQIKCQILLKATRINTTNYHKPPKIKNYHHSVVECLCMAGGRHMDGKAAPNQSYKIANTGP